MVGADGALAGIAGDVPKPAATDNTKFLRGDATWVTVGGSAGVGTDLLIYQEQQAQNTNGGTFTSGAWQTRILNTEVTDTGGHGSVASNQITRVAGTYRIYASAPASYCQAHQTRWQNVTDATTTVVGTSEYSAISNTDLVQTRSIVDGRFTIAGTKTFELQHRCQTTRATTGLGFPANLTTEVYSTVRLEREA
jgi:hypothetical protein